ncbi:MAG: ABC transporter permease [Acidobacteria bacterium]|nr:ABC transporter permease [Acidobacteriota bacterium]
MINARRVYRLLLKFYPARFREEYAASMDRQFIDEYREVTTRGERLRFWARTCVDLATSIPAQIASELVQDVRYARRVYGRRPLVTALAFAALALGIGATTGVFSVLNALLLRGLPFARPEELVEIQGSPVNPMGGRARFYQWRDASAYAEDIAAYSSTDMNLGAGPEAARVTVAEVSAGFLNVMGRAPGFGRGFLPDEDLPGHDDVAVIGYALWQQLFGGDPSVLGKTIELNGTPLKVVGVAPAGFEYPGKTAVWAPMAFDLPKIAKSGVVFYREIVRLKPGLTLAQAAQMFRAEVSRLNPNLLKPASSSGFVRPPPTLIPLREQLVGDVRQSSLVLMGVVVFVLLVGCANVAQLLLTRVAERRGELAIRAALGASRARLVQQLITESALLTGLATLAGLVIARWTAGLAANVQPAPIATLGYTTVDWRVLLFAGVMAAVTGVLFGVIPAWLTGRMQPSDQNLRATGVRSTAVRRTRTALIAAQVAFTVALVGGSVLMCRTFLHLLGSDLGFRTDHMVTLNVSLAGTAYDGEDGMLQYYRQAVDRLRSVPGVESAAAVPYLPLMQNMYAGYMFRPAPGREGLTAVTISATPDYFRTLGTGIVEGREFTAADRASSEPVIVVNEEFARSFEGGPHLAGRRIWDWQGKRHYTVVGVAKTVQLFGPGSPAGPQAFLPFEQAPPSFATFVARVRGNAGDYLAVCRDAVRQADPRIPVYDEKTLDQRLADNLARPRFYTTAITFLAGFALLVAVIGIYGAASYAITQRTKEIGVRVAVGARMTDVRLMLLRQGMWPVAAGVAMGVGGTLAFGRFIKNLIASAPNPELGTWAPAAGVLAATGAIAVWVASRRLLRMDPSAALRAD